MITGQFRASYAHVFNPHGMNGADPKYSITMLIPKTDVTTINTIYAEIEKVKQEAMSSTFGGVVPPMLTIPFYDGDGVMPSTGMPFSEECKGHMVLRSSSKQQPSVVDLNLQPIINPTQFYSGCYARADVNFYAYVQTGKKGIACGLNNLQKLADGEPLSGKTSPEDSFGGTNSYVGEIPQQPQYQVPQQPQYQAPGQPAYQAPQYQVPQPQYQAPAQAQYQVPQQPQYQAPAQPQYQAPVPQPQIDPITGLPVMGGGGVMGL